MGYSTKYSYLIEEAGFLFHHLEPHLKEKDIEQIMKADQMKTVRHPFTFTMLNSRVENEKKLIAKYKPVAIVIGTTLSMFISARACSIPLVYIKPFAYTRPYFLYGHLELPHFLQVRMIPQQFTLNLLRKLALGITMKPRSFNKVAKLQNVRLPKYTIDALDADYNLITTVPEITGVTKLPDNYMYVGPVFAKLNGEIPKEIRTISRQYPVIYFAMGSSGGKDLIIKILLALSELPVTVICPMRKVLGSSTSLFLNKKNIYLFDLLPAHKLAEFIDLSIIHGGEGTVQTACLTGKPFIGVGLQPEQISNIKDCVIFGNALELRKNRISKSKIEKLIHTAVNDQQLKKRARIMKDLLENKDGATNAAKFLIEKFG